MLTLHIGNKNYSSWSLRPWVLMTELGIGFEERLHRFGVPEFERAVGAVSPSRKVPCLVDDGVVVWDSLAIAEYLAESNASVWPADAKARAWARSASAEMHAGFPVLRECASMSVGIRARLLDHPPALRADVARIDGLFGDGLRLFGGPFLAGASFTAVDAFFAPVAFRVQTYGLELAPAGTEYVRRLLSLSSMQRWEAEGIAEAFRDEAHEVEIGARAEILEDRRAPAQT